MLLDILSKEEDLLKLYAMGRSEYPGVVYQWPSTDVGEGPTAGLVVEGGLPGPVPLSGVNSIDDPAHRKSGKTGSWKKALIYLFKILCESIGRGELL